METLPVLPRPALQQLPPAIDDFLGRRRPKIDGLDREIIIPEGPDCLNEATAATERLQDSILCIQGPPGTGKTWTAAQIILALLQHGKRVGLSSNSHKAIGKLMEEVYERMVAAGCRIKACKIGGDREELEERFVGLTWVDTARNVPLEAELIGGTAWAFSDPVMEKRIDHLFVHEAGQVSSLEHMRLINLFC